MRDRVRLMTDWPDSSNGVIGQERVTMRKKGVIEAGTFGTKMIAILTSTDGLNGVFFVKPGGSRQQIETHRYFLERNVNVPPVFELCAQDNGMNATVISDLTNNGKYQVISIDDTDPSLVTVCGKMPESTLERIQTSLLTAVDVASRTGERLSDKDIIFELNPHPFILQINPQDPQDANVYLGDFEGDVHRRDGSHQESVLVTNMTNAACFYSWATGHPFSLPDSHPLCSWNHKFIDWCSTLREERGFDRMRELMKFVDVTQN